jgi:hypothetical protein
MVYTKEVQKLKDQLDKEGSEFSRCLKKDVDTIYADINGIGKKINRIWWGIVAVGLLVLTNNDLASKIIIKIFHLN